MSWTNSINIFRQHNLLIQHISKFTFEMFVAILRELLGTVPDALCLIIAQFGQICSSNCPQRIIGPETSCPDCRSTYFCCSQCFPKCKICLKNMCTMECVVRGIADYPEERQIDEFLAENHDFTRTEIYEMCRRYSKKCIVCEDLICNECAEGRGYRCGDCEMFLCPLCRVECSRCGDSICATCGRSDSRRKGQVCAKCVEFMSKED
jgi:hypothetical protein